MKLKNKKNKMHNHKKKIKTNIYMFWEYCFQVYFV